MSCPCIQQLNASSLATMGTSFKWIGMIRATRVEQPAAEAKKAEGASWAALLMPSPPRLTGRVAWVRDETEAGRHMLVMLLVMVLSRSSYSTSSGETKQGEVWRVYDNLLFYYYYYY